MAYNADDPKQVRKAKKEADLSNAIHADVTKQIMSTAAGRKWMHSLLEQCHCFHTSIVFGEQDKTAFREGERNIGNYLLAHVQAACPEFYLIMLKESKPN